jgi:hypothetical protein
MEMSMCGDFNAGVTLAERLPAEADPEVDSVDDSLVSELIFNLSSKASQLRLIKSR